MEIIHQKTVELSTEACQRFSAPTITLWGTPNKKRMATVSSKPSNCDIKKLCGHTPKHAFYMFFGCPLCNQPFFRSSFCRVRIDRQYPMLILVFAIQLRQSYGSHSMLEEGQRGVVRWIPWNSGDPFINPDWAEKPACR